MKNILVIAIVILIAIGFYMAPGMVQSAIPSVYYVTPNQKTYKNVVNCSGTVQSESVREIYLQSAIVAAEVCVEVGDEVDEGDVLVTVDADMTEKISSASGIIRGLSQDALGLGGTGVDWSALASSYGLTAVLNGGVDEESIRGILQNSGIGNQNANATSGAIVGGDNLADIKAPMPGVVTEVNIRPQSPAPAGMAILTITDAGHYKVMASVGESDIAKIQPGDSAKVRGVGFGGSVYSGTVTKIYPTARKSLSGTGADTVVDVEISLDYPDGNLKPGFSAKVEITGGSNYEMITVPYEAIRQDENNDEYVYLYEGGKLKKQVVVTGQELTSEVEILDGLDFDSVVVYNPSGIVKEGSMIHIKGRAD